MIIGSIQANIVRSMATRSFWNQDSTEDEPNGKTTEQPPAMLILNTSQQPVHLHGLAFVFIVL